MSNSTLISYTHLSPNKGIWNDDGTYYADRNSEIRKITVHHWAMVGASLEDVCASFANPARGASANYVIDSDGRIALCVEEKYRAWSSGDVINDGQAINIEVANDGGAPDWHVSDAAWDSLVRLCADICRRNPVIGKLNYTGDASGNLTTHDMFQATLCPGPYLKGRMGELAEEVNRLLDEPEEEVYYRVQVGAFSEKNGALRMKDLVEAAGFETYMIKADGYYKIQVGAFEKRENAEGLLEKIEKAGFSAFITKKSGEAVPEDAPEVIEKSLDEIAREVIRGDWGNGAERVQRLTAAGYDAGAVQGRVNALLK